MQKSSLHLSPSLFPVLTILSKLSGGSGSQNKAVLEQLRAHVLQLTGSCVLSVRKLAAGLLLTSREGVALE